MLSICPFLSLTMSVRLVCSRTTTTIKCANEPTIFFIYEIMEKKETNHFLFFLLFCFVSPMLFIKSVGQTKPSLCG